MPISFKALQVTQREDKRFERHIIKRSTAELPAGELLVQVHYSSLNYKDALSATGNPGVTRNFPHTPGIDAAGEVLECSNGAFEPGAKVIVTSHDLGMETDGGFGQMIRVPSAWALPLPEGLSLKESMIFGTAGLTAALSVREIIESSRISGQEPVLVTGATGGVGSIAVGLLARAGFKVTAATGKPNEAQYLEYLGAHEIIDRASVTQGSERPMLKPRWGAVVDCVGGEILSAAIKATHYDGVVTCCGLVGSPELDLNVFPFILRGVRLVGIDSAECPMQRRRQAWHYLAGAGKLDQLPQMHEEVGLDGLDTRIAAMLKGRLKRRVLVDLRR
ncbi:MAG: YhdH/YhfP family quinone oxidoreductase [Desulfuromonadaceae bacterium]|nr:YhdH/YhfP family quinone oxidoreductase [Desulfuromonas sp.]MDY0185057.1 YhdH/YhfP family quinone oxidoreductase [Desulfuromonadaceae bacterium]